MRRNKLILALVVGLSAAANSRSAETRSTETQDVAQVVVTGETVQESLTSPSIGEAAEQESEVPGGFTLRTTDEMKRGRTSNFDDLLQRVPGVFLQTDNGTEVTRISIRGSGILSEDEPLGVQFMLDGLTLNQGDGEAILEDFDLSTIKYLELFRGANAFKYGSMTLGGAINLVAMTGHDSDPFQIRLEGGSFGYFRGQINGGGVAGPFDFIGSVMSRYRDGFRNHSRENTQRFFGDVGYTINDHWENRFYLTFDHVGRQLPGGLTKEQMNDNPELANPNAIREDFNKSWDFFRLADKLSYRDGGRSFDAGFFWFHRNVEERGFFEDNFREGITAFYSDNFGAALNSVSHGDLFGRRNIFTIGLSPQFEREDSQNFENLGGQRGATTARGTSLSINLPFYVEDQHYLTDKFSFLLGMQTIYAQRHFEDHFPTDDQGNQSHQQDFYGWNQKAGLIYEFTKKNQVFANFSGSWQPPSFDNMVEFRDGTNSSVVYTPLHPQRGQTLEIGTRGEHGRFEWELSFYHTWLRNELLELNDAQGNDIGAVNVERSYHRGIEIELEIELLNSALQSNDQLTLSQTYTLGDFHFDDDPVYGNNRIAGIPVNFYETELLYITPAGFYLGPNLRWNMSRYPADHADTLFADPYALLGFKIGYRPRKGLSVFLEAKNLTDKRFPSAVDPIADARTEENPTIFHPGDGRAVYGGVSWSW